MAYSQERRAAVLVKMLAPSRMTITALSRQEGICERILYKWRREARAQGRLAPDKRLSDTERERIVATWSSPQVAKKC